MYSPELLHPLVRVRDSVEVFGRAGRGKQVINLVMLRDNLTEGGMDTVGRGDIAVVRGDLWCAEGAVFLAQWEFVRSYCSELGFSFWQFATSFLVWCSSSSISL